MNNSILVVDDEQLIRDMLQVAFGQAGYDVLPAASGEEALDVLMRENIHVAFLDLKLTGMSGVDLCRQIKSDVPIACVYALTAHPSLFDLAECREAGFDDYFVKPVNLALLFKAAEEAFEKLERWKER